MPSRKYNPGSIRQLILSAGPFKASLSASDRNRVGTIWAQLSSDSELQYITIPEELVRKLGRLVSSSSPNEQWIEKFESAWRKYKALTGSRITFADFAQAAHTCMLESARAKGTLTQNPSVNIKMTLPTGNNPRKDTFAGRGIANLGQTCYLGATVQFATGCEPFFGAFVQTPFPDQKIPDSTHGQSEDAKKLMLARELRTILIQAEDTKADGPLNPEKLERCLLAVKQDWTRGNQQDAHEAWLTLQGALHACTNRAEGQVESFQYPVNEDIVATADRNWDSIRKFQSDSCAERPFLGQYAMERACRDCGTPKPVTFGSSTVTHLKMPKRIRQAAVIANKPLTIMDLLHENYAAEIVELKCETCGKSSFSQDESIMHLPQYLVFMIARFENGPDGVKFKDRVHFEVDGLDVHEFVHPRRRTLDHPKYDCRAVIHHLGDTLRSGHYVTYLREEKSDEEESRWVLYNDEVVLLVGDQAEIMGPHCYMIMYERRHETAPPSVAQSPSFPLSTPPPASPKQETKNKASALGKERLSASPPSSRPASPRQKTEDAIEKRRLAVEGARSAYESVRANPNTIGKMLRLYETTLKKAEKAYEEAKKGELMEPE